jgi:undecaprenyl-diphosphatase
MAVARPHTRTEPMPRRRLVRAAILAGLLVACAAVFIWMLQLAAAGAIDEVDRWLARWVVTRRSPGLTRVATDLTALGSRTLLTIATSIVCLLLWTGGRRIAALDTALATSAAALVTRATKILLGRPRPSAAEALVHVGGFSFPSGHTSGITALLAATALHSFEAARSRAQRVVLVVFYGVLALGVAWSRVYLGVHYPSDVAAGLCVGVGCALLAHGLVRTPVILRRVRELLRRAP